MLLSYFATCSCLNRYRNPGSRLIVLAIKRAPVCVDVALEGVTRASFRTVRRAGPAGEGEPRSELPWQLAAQPSPENCLAPATACLFSASLVPVGDG
jgi:hypothetical protein